MTLTNAIVENDKTFRKRFQNVKKTYLELKNHISEGTLFSSTFKVEENKVPSELSNFAYRRHFRIFLHIYYYKFIRYHSLNQL